MMRAGKLNVAVDVCTDEGITPLEEGTTVFILEENDGTAVVCTTDRKTEFYADMSTIDEIDLDRPLTIMIAVEETRIDLARLNIHLDKGTVEELAQAALLDAAQTHLRNKILKLLENDDV